MRYDPVPGLARGDLHLARMQRSAAFLGLPFDPEHARQVLEGIMADTPLRCRLTLDIEGNFDLTTMPLGASADVWRVAISPVRVHSGDIWLRYKTTRRALYDEARANLPEGVDELLFLNERGEVCEGTITNLFVTLTDGTVVTPPLLCGVLPGVLRQDMLQQGAVEETVLFTDDLHATSHMWVGNALRGRIRAQLVT